MKMEVAAAAIPSAGAHLLAPTIAIIWQIERRRQRRREGFRVSICHEKFLLHLNQGAPPQ